MLTGALVSRYRLWLWLEPSHVSTAKCQLPSLTFTADFIGEDDPFQNSPYR
jgi:hypothetical protein